MHVLSYEEIYPEGAGLLQPSSPSTNLILPAPSSTGNLGSAFYGLPGRVVEAIEPHSEADPYGLLLTFLVGFGAAVGRSPHAFVEASRHPARLYVVLVGPTSKGRKGTSWSQVKRILEVADPEFMLNRSMGGFASAEALVDVCADGSDERLLIFEAEWARLLAVGRREGSTLSPLLRDAWDTDRLATRARSGVAPI
jgi:hypothetical protein